MSSASPSDGFPCRTFCPLDTADYEAIEALKSERTLESQRQIEQYEIEIEDRHRRCGKGAVSLAGVPSFGCGLEHLDQVRLAGGNHAS